MALTNCPECDQQISDQAYYCTNCGYQVRKPKRGIFGKLYKFLFYAFNIFMLLWCIGVWVYVNVLSTGPSSDIERAGAALGGVIGTGILVQLWIWGDVILGLLVYFTKPKYK